MHLLRLTFLLCIIVLSGCEDAPLTQNDAPDMAPDMAPAADAALDLPPPDMPAPDLAEEMDAPDMAQDMAQDMARDMDAPDMVPAAWRGHCAEVDRFNPVFPDIIARWVAQDDTSPAWPDPVVFVGSSSMRRWETLASQYSSYNPVQRGFGGAQLGEVAYYAQQLIVRHQPRGVVVFAGTNDIAAGVAPEVVVERLRCLRERIGDGAGWHIPIVFIGITPTPSRWASWPQSDAVNQAVIALAAQDPALHYADVPAPFLRTGSPPADSLFVEDRLHLSLAGYTLWQQVVGLVVAAAIAPAPARAAALVPGARFLIDLGPSNAQDGAPTGTDAAGRVWNSWHAIDGDGQVSPGERLARLVTAQGARTEVALVIAGGFGVNGLEHGGVTAPAASLGALATPTATQDFFYADDSDLPGGLYLSGLDATRTYTLRLYGARRAPERRVTRYVVAGEGAARTATLQTSGQGAGQGDGNHDDVAVVEGVRPDAYGHIFIDVQRAEGAYAYLNALEIVVE